METPTPIEVWRDGKRIATCSRLELPDGGCIEFYDAHGNDVSDIDMSGDLSLYGAPAAPALTREQIDTHDAELAAPIDADLRAGRIRQGEDAIVNAFDNSRLLKDRPFDVVAAMTDDEQKTALAQIEAHDYKLSGFASVRELVSLVAAFGVERMVNKVALDIE